MDGARSRQATDVPPRGKHIRDACEGRGRRDRGGQPVVYEDVYVVEAILQDGDAHRNGQPHHTGHYQHEGDLSQPTNAYRVGDDERERGACGQHRQGIGKPLYLLALHSIRVAQSHQHGRRSAGAPNTDPGY
jgi:hypothetical protein